MATRDYLIDPNGQKSSPSIWHDDVELCIQTSLVPRLLTILGTRLHLDLKSPLILKTFWHCIVKNPISHSVFVWGPHIYMTLYWLVSYSVWCSKLLALQVTVIIMFRSSSLFRLACTIVVLHPGVTDMPTTYIPEFHTYYSVLQCTRPFI